jgi:hypothetical protein
MLAIHPSLRRASIATFLLMTVGSANLLGCKPKVPTQTGAGTASTLTETGEPNTLRIGDGATYFKKTKGPAYQLAESDKCLLMEGDTIRYQGQLGFEADHLLLTLDSTSQPNCPFRTGYLYGPQYASLVRGNAAMAPGSVQSGDGPTINQSSSGEFPDYDAAYGQRIANAARNPDGKYRSGRCFQAVADALDAALGRGAQNYGRLNLPPYCARTFSDNWNPGVHQPQFHLRKIATSDRSILERLPIGSVIVTGRCGMQLTCAGGYPGAGDIMVKVDSAGTTASFYTSSIRSGCAATAPLLAVFIPTRQ